MLSLQKPSAESIRRFLAEQTKLPYTYPAVGATALTLPTGFVVDQKQRRGMFVEVRYGTR